MAGEQVEILIDANGLARTERTFKLLDGYLERVQRRVEKLGRMKVSPIVRLTDRVTEPLLRLNRLLNRLGAQSRRIALFGVGGAGQPSPGAPARGNSLSISQRSLQFFLNLTKSADKPKEEKKPKSIWDQLKKYGLDQLKKFGQMFVDDFLKTLYEKLKSKLPASVRKLITPSDASKTGENGSSNGNGSANGNNGDVGRRSASGKSRGPKRGNKARVRNNKDRVGSKKDLGRSNGERTGESKAAEQPTARAGGRGGRTPSALGRAGRLADGAQQVLSRAGGWAKSLLGKGKASGLAKLAIGGAAAVAGYATSKLKPGNLLRSAASIMPDKVLQAAAKLKPASLARLAGKAFKPLGFVTDAIDIFKAKPGKARNKAIGKTAGGWAGAAAGAQLGALAGSIVPGVGTVVGGLVGGAIGGFVGSGIGGNIADRAGKAMGRLKGMWRGRKRISNPASSPANSLAAAPSGLQAAFVPASGLLLAGSSANLARKPSPKEPSGPVNLSVNVPAGAVQITVKDGKPDYAAIAAAVGDRIAASVRMAIENRA